MLRRVLLLWVVGSAVGGALVALPDTDERVFSLSRTHGPSVLDLVGMVVLLVAWLPVPIALYRHRHEVRPRIWAVCGGAAVLAGIALAVSIVRDSGWWWLPAALLLALAQGVPLVAAGGWRQGRRHQPLTRQPR